MCSIRGSALGLFLQQPHFVILLLEGRESGLVEVIRGSFRDSFDHGKHRVGILRKVYVRFLGA